MLDDGDDGEFVTHVIWDEVTVKWSWSEPEDYEMDGYFDIFVFKDGLDITYDIPKLQFKWIEAEVKNTQAMSRLATSGSHLSSTV